MHSSAVLGGITATAVIIMAAGYFLYRKRRREFRVVGTVSRICLFPIKSCSGISLQSAGCTTAGLQVEGLSDRQWMILDADNKFVTMKHNPKLANIKTRLSEDGQSFCLNGKNMPVLEIPIMQENAEIVNTRYHSLPLDVQHCGQAASEWICKYLNEDGYKLVKLDDRGRELHADPTWGSHHKQGEMGFFHDESQFHLCTEDSLKDLNTRLDQSVTMDTFRPNFVIKGSSPYEEDDWSYVNIGGSVTFRKSFRTGRCRKTLVDRNTETFREEPLQTLRKYRMCSSSDTDKKKYGTCPLFGVHLVATSFGTINVGDEVFAAC